jgi:hypothetical protein
MTAEIDSFDMFCYLITHIPLLARAIDGSCMILNILNNNSYFCNSHPIAVASSQLLFQLMRPD